MIMGALDKSTAAGAKALARDGFAVGDDVVGDRNESRTVPTSGEQQEVLPLGDDVMHPHSGYN